MAYIRLTHSSAHLGAVDVSIFFPDSGRVRAPADPRNEHHVTYLMKWLPYDKDKRYKVLWLFHGGSGNHSNWVIESKNHYLSTGKDLVIVMPNYANALNSVPAMDYQKYLIEDLMPFVSHLLPISTKREDNFIAGLSYGGYFSYMTALNYPELFSCVGSFSSPLNVRHDVEIYHNGQPGYPSPEEIDGSRYDVLHLAAKLKEEGRPIPKMFQCCGTEDFTWDFNCEARDHFRSLGLAHTWEQWSGIHNFEFWDEALRHFLAWLPLDSKEKEGK